MQTLAAWFSPGYPVGAYSYSHGLEWAVEAGWVTGRAGLAAWTADLLAHGAGRTDALLLAAAWRADDPAPGRRARRGARRLLRAPPRDHGAGRGLRPHHQRRLRHRRPADAPTRSPSATPRASSALPLAADRDALAPGLRRQHRLGRGAPDPARPDRRPAHHRRRSCRSPPRSPRAAVAAADPLEADRRPRARRRPRGHAARDPVHPPLPLLSAPRMLWSRLRRLSRRPARDPGPPRPRPPSPRSPNGPLRVGIGGPVGAGKTALMDQLCKRMRDRWSIAAITNDIYTREDAEFLMRSQALPLDRIIGVETGGCPHTAIREDASINLAAVDELVRRFPDLDLDPDRIGRRQPLRHLLARARRPHALRHRRLRPATRSRARAAPASPAPTSSSSTRSTSPPTSAPRSTSWTATAAGCAASARSSSPRSATASACRRSIAFIETAGGLVT